MLLFEINATCDGKTFRENVWAADEEEAQTKGIAMIAADWRIDLPDYAGATDDDDPEFDFICEIDSFDVSENTWDQAYLDLIQAARNAIKTPNSAAFAVLSSALELAESFAQQNIMPRPEPAEDVPEAV